MPAEASGARHRRRLALTIAVLLGVLAVPVTMSLGQHRGSGAAVGPVPAPVGSVRTVPFDPSHLRPPAPPTWSAWPQALHDARHSGSSSLSGPRHGGIVWRRHLSDGAVPGGPVIGQDGTIYVVDAMGRLHAVQPGTGRDRWSVDTGFPVGGDLSTSPLVLPSGEVVAQTEDGLAAWSPAGKRVWDVPLSVGALTSPVTSDGRRLYVGSRGGVVLAIDVEGRTARQVWGLDLRIDQSYGSVVTDGRGRIYQTSPVGVVAVDDLGNRATIAWSTDAHDGLVEVSPGLSSSGTVVLGTNGDHEWAYDHRGRLSWRASRHITYSSPSVTESGLAFVGEHDDRLHVFDVRDGQEVGLFPTTVTHVAGKTRVWTSVVVDATYTFYFATRTHFLVGVRPDGTRLFTTDLGAPSSSYPALSADRGLIIGTDAGDLVKVD